MPDDRHKLDLSQFWHELNASAGGPVAGEQELDPDLAETIRQLHAMTSAPPPAGASARVDRAMLPRLMTSNNGKVTTMDGTFALNRELTAAGGWSLPQTRTAHVTRRRLPRVNRAVLQTATALLIILALLTGYFLTHQHHPAIVGPAPGTPTTIAARCGTTAGGTPAASPVPVALRAATPAAGTGPRVAFGWAIDAGTGQVGNLAIDPKCRLWVMDVQADRFLIYDLAGKLLATWGTQGSGNGQFDFAGNGYFGGVAFAPDGGFYVVDIGNARVQQFAADRTFVRSWTVTDSTGGVVLPDWIAVGPNGDVYVSTDAPPGSGSIQVFTPDGHPLRRFGSPLHGDNALGAIAFDPAGNVWVQVVSSPVSLLEFSPAGAPLGRLDLSAQVQPGGFGLAIDAAGRFYVVDAAGGQVAVFSSHGAWLYSFGASGVAPGQFNGPRWIVLDGTDGVYIAEPYGRVQRFQLQP